MQKLISTLQFITPQPTYSSLFFKTIETIAKSGIHWIQYRDKENNLDDFLKIATEVQSICKSHSITFIVNDKVEAALQLQADGVHVGQTDLSIAETKKIIGADKIVGTSTNNIQQIKKAFAEGVDYIGLGPFAFTTTKQKLNPIIGFDGYKSIYENDFLRNKKMPIVAIGGLQITDIEPLKSVGNNGFAMSSLIYNATDIPATISTLKTLIGNDWF
jgi:thiamine-phosphate pyrophosphorylase